MRMIQLKFILPVNCAIIILSVWFFMVMDQRSVSGRKLPIKNAGHTTTPVLFTDTQRDVYPIYRDLGLCGATIIHLNNFFNLEQYTPAEFGRSVPFPIPLLDLAQLYEKGLSSHNWLYIASRTGLVRSILTVLPDSVFRLRFNDMVDSPDLVYRKPVFTGYSFDTPRSVVTLETLPRINEPVIVNVDAGYFMDGTSPEKVASLLRSACPDIRGIVMVRSIDEPGIDVKMTMSLEKLRDIWQRH